jgi:hypothetical protein
MVDKLIKSEIAQCELSNSDAELLHFDSCSTIVFKSGSRCSLRCPEGSYKLLKGYPPSPQVVNLISPSPRGEGF